MAMKYTAGFKREAVRMMTELGLGVTKVSKKLGVAQSQLYDWRKKARLAGMVAAIPGSGHLTPLEEEHCTLKAKIKRPEMEWDILKTASAIFARQME